MKKLTVAALAVVALTTTGVSHAAKKEAKKAAPAKKAPAKKGVDSSDNALGAKLGTLGFGVEWSKPIDENWNGRLGINYWTKSDDRTESGIRYEGDLDLNTYAFLADYHGKKSGWRATGGFMINNNDITLTATTTAATGVTIGGTAVAAGTAGSLRSKVDFKSFAPYLGVGYGNPFGEDGDRDWSFSLDLGVLFQGSPDAKLSTTFAGVTAAALATAQAELENAIDDFDIYPVISIGATYRF